MADIVGAFAMSHQLGAPDSVEDASERVFAGMREIGRRIRALEPDLLVIVTSDHLNNFSLGDPAPFAIGTAAQFQPLGDMGLPRDPVPGAPGFAAGFLACDKARMLGVGAADPIQPDHGVMIPLGIVDPDRRIPAVPLYVNTVFYPDPAPVASRRLGEALGAHVAQRTGDERIVLLAAGGLSHWVGTPEEGTINEAWDHQFLTDMLAGDIDALATLTNETILAVAGNGGLEVNAWIAVAAAVPGARGTCLFYEPIAEWATGMAGVELHV